MARDIVIVPNEELIETGVWAINLVDNDRHGKGIHEYSNLNNLGLTFENVGDNDASYNGYLWGVALAKIGHVSLHIDNDLIIYVPSIITKGQYQFFKKHRKFIERYNNRVSSCFIEDGKPVLVIGDPDNDFPVSPVKLFYDELKTKYNSTYNKEKILKK